MPRDYYEVLGLSKDASPKEIKKSYHKLAVQHHPDHNQSDASAEEKFKEVAMAYEVLSNKDKRAEYDAYGHRGAPNRGAAGWDPFAGRSPFGADIFEEFFGGRRRQEPSPAGRDIIAEMSISFLEAAHGTTKSVTIERSVTCVTCSGEGGTGRQTCSQCGGAGCITFRQGMMVMQTTCNVCAGTTEVLESMCSDCHGRGVTLGSSQTTIQVPPGISAGNHLRITGLGHHGKGTPGHLLINVKVQEHPEFKKHGKNIHSALNLTVSEATLGCDKIVDTVHGRKDARIPTGAQPGLAIRLLGFGVTDLNNTKRGDHILEIQVTIPTEITPRQRELFVELAIEEKHDEVAR